MNAAGSGAALLTSDSDWDPTWSPDGRRVAFTSIRDGNDEIYAINADGSGIARLTDDPADDRGPSWSPDGRRIAFASNRDGNFDIYAMSADGSGAERLADTSGGEHSPSWGPATAAADTPTPSPTPQPSETPTPTPQPSEPPTPTPDAPTATPQPSETPTPQPPQDCEIRQGMQTRLHSVLDTITREQDGHVEVSFRNPGANDCAVDADLGVSVPSNIIISSKDGSGGTAGTVNFIVSDIRPSLERSISMDFKCLRRGEYTINFSGSYWPSGDKSGYQPITLHQSLTCEEPSATMIFPTPAPESAGGASVQSAPPSVPKPPAAGGESVGNGGVNSLVIGGGLIFALIVIVALVALGRKSN